MTTPKDREYTACLLHIFDAETLGDGNVDAGANVLAAMALTIANVQRPGASVVGEDGLRTALGCNLVMSGALTSSLVADRILAPLQANQDNVFANVRHWEEDEKRRLDKLVRTGREADGEPENPPTPALVGLDRDAMLDEVEHTARCWKLLVPPPGAGFHEICRHPLVFGIAGSPETFARMMECAHLGRALVHVALHEAADCPAYQKVASRLTHGCQLFEPDMRSVRGELMVTDPGNALGEALRGGLAGTGWLGGALSLSDHAAGPEFEAKARDATDAKLDLVTTRFRLALNQSWAERLSAGEGKPAKLQCDVRKFQHAWVDFLLSLEPGFSGITGALRSLPASLLYGLHRFAPHTNMRRTFRCSTSTGCMPSPDCWRCAWSTPAS